MLRAHYLVGLKALHAKDNGIRKVAAELGIGVSTVQRIEVGG